MSGIPADTDGRIALSVALDRLRREVETPLVSVETIELIESGLSLPSGARALHEYTRIYAADEAAGTIVGFYLYGIDRRERRRIWEMPRVFDGGCDIVRFEYAMRESRLHWIACNGAHPVLAEP